MVIELAGSEFEINSLVNQIVRVYFNVEHRPNTRMHHADALSRHANLVGRELALSKERIREEQEKDAQCQEYKQYDDFWLYEENTLYHQKVKGQPRVVIPKTFVPTVLECYHNLPFSALQGVGRTVEFINCKYWWETMWRDIKEYIKVCDACAKWKTGHRIHAPMGEALEANEFLDIVSLDVVGPLPVTERGNKYLLTFVDHFTRFCEAIPIPSQEKETTAREFVTKIIVQYGVPKKLLTDRGSNITSALMTET
jgi:hypothetical protein